MLRAHSLLWHYLWIGPNVLLLGAAVVAWRRHLGKQFPVFLIFASAMAVEQLVLYAADVNPAVDPDTWWKFFWVGLLLEALLKFALIGELFERIFGLYSSIARLGKTLITSVGVLLVFLAAVVAAYTPKDNTRWIVAGAHILEQTIYLIECGIILFLFLFSAYFKLRWDRLAFGITLGLAISACVHLATFALTANGSAQAQYRPYLDFPVMFAYHLCVLIWIYYLFVRQKSPARPQLPPQHNLELWNRELERLLQQ
jgi:hypothetical protein